jgi:hypothetical protein
MKKIVRGSGDYGVSFEYKKSSVGWIKEEIFFSSRDQRDAAIKRIKKHPYNYRVRPI